MSINTVGFTHGYYNLATLWQIFCSIISISTLNSYYSLKINFMPFILKSVCIFVADKFF
jgi:hypothetical protein